MTGVGEAGVCDPPSRAAQAVRARPVHAWPLEREEALRRLWPDLSLTKEAIAARLGVSVLAVSAKRKAMGLPVRKAGGRPGVPQPRRQSVWTASPWPQRDGELRHWWEQTSVSAAQIAGRLGTTKNAVIGRAHRLQLAPRPSPIRRPAGDASARPARRPARVPAGAMTLVLHPADPSRMEVAAPPCVGAVPLAASRPAAPLPVRLRRTEPCCWPVGEPRTPGFRFCDEPSEPGRAYCPAHCARAREPARRRPMELVRT